MKNNHLLTLRHAGRVIRLRAAAAVPCRVIPATSADAQPAVVATQRRAVPRVAVRRATPLADAQPGVATSAADVQPVTAAPPVHCSLADLRATAALRAPGYLADVLAAALSVSGDDVLLPRPARDRLRAQYLTLDTLPPAAVAHRAAACAACQWRNVARPGAMRLVSDCQRDRCDHPARPCARLYPASRRETCPSDRWPPPVCNPA